VLRDGQHVLCPAASGGLPPPRVRSYNGLRRAHARVCVPTANAPVVTRVHTDAKTSPKRV